MASHPSSHARIVLETVLSQQINTVLAQVPGRGAVIQRPFANDILISLQPIGEDFFLFRSICTGCSYITMVARFAPGGQFPALSPDTCALCTGINHVASRLCFARNSIIRGAQTRPYSPRDAGVGLSPAARRTTVCPHPSQNKVPLRISCLPITFPSSFLPNCSRHQAFAAL